MSNFEDLLLDNPVIGAIRNDEDLDVVLNSDIKLVFVLYGNILNIKSISEKLNQNGKIVFIHLDMVDGLKGDQMGIEFIKEVANPYGVISTKGINLKHASHLGMITIQRIFVIDSLAFETGIKNIHAFSPNAVEVLPGIATKAIKKLQNKIKQPIIAGGLIKNKKDAMEALSSGAMAVSTSSQELWEIEDKNL